MSAYSRIGLTVNEDVLADTEGAFRARSVYPLWLEKEKERETHEGLYDFFPEADGDRLRYEAKHVDVVFQRVGERGEDRIFRMDGVGIREEQPFAVRPFLGLV